MMEPTEAWAVFGVDGSFCVAGDTEDDAWSFISAVTNATVDEVKQSGEFVCKRVRITVVEG